MKKANVSIFFWIPRDRAVLTLSSTVRCSCQTERQTSVRSHGTFPVGTIAFLFLYKSPTVTTKIIWYTLSWSRTFYNVYSFWSVFEIRSFSYRLLVPNKKVGFTFVTQSWLIIILKPEKRNKQCSYQVRYRYRYQTFGTLRVISENHKRKGQHRNTELFQSSQYLWEVCHMFTFWVHVCLFLVFWEAKTTAYSIASRESHFGRWKEFFQSAFTNNRFPLSLNSVDRNGSR